MDQLLCLNAAYVVIGTQGLYLLSIHRALSVFLLPEAELAGIHLPKTGYRRQVRSTGQVVIRCVRFPSIFAR